MQKRIQFEKMMSLRVQFLCFLLCFHGGVSGLPVCGEENHEQFFINSDVLPFQEEFEKLFRHFNESDTEQLERFSQLLKTIDPNAFDDAARMEVENTNRVSFVVRSKCEMSVNSVEKQKRLFCSPIESSGLDIPLKIMN